MMCHEPDDNDDLLNRAANGDRQAIDRVFDLYRSRLKKMVRLRLNRRLQGRVDDSDILQDAFLEAAKKLPDYLQDPRASFFLWLRRITGDKLLEVHRTHLGTQMRDVGREVLALRHFEQLTNMEAAQELDLDPSAASKRYRALTRLQKIRRELQLLDEG